MKQFLEEWAHMVSGKTLYLLIFVPVVAAVMFGYVFKNNQLNEAPLAIVDLDQSTYSTQLINKLNASQYIDVKEVYHQAVEPDALLYNEKFMGVLFLPKGMEAARLQGQQSNLGFYVDMSVSAAVGNLRSAVTEVVTAENTAFGVGRLKATGLSDGQATAVINGLAVQQRQLYNPTNDMLPNAVFGFVNTSLLALMGGAALGIVPRLRQEGKLAENMRAPLEVAVRVLPYALVTSVSLFFSVGLLKQVAGMRFEANPFQMGVPFLLYTVNLGLMGMLIGWSAPTPEKAAGRSMLLIMPAFMLGGTQVPIAMLPEPLQLVSRIIPISWHFKFVRGLGLRGGDLWFFLPEIGSFLLLTGAFLTGILLLTLGEQRRQKRGEDDPVSHLLEEEDAVVSGLATAASAAAGARSAPLDAR